MKTLRNMVTIGSIILSSLLPMKKAQAQDKEVTGNFSTSLVSHYIPSMGYVLGKGPHQQNYAGVNFKGLTAFKWSNYDFGNKEMSEIDVGVQYAKQFNENTSATAGLAYWHYPKGDDDKVASVSVAHNKGLNKSLSLLWLLKDQEVGNGFSVRGDLSRTFDHENGFSTTAGISAAHVENFYNDYGFAHVTPNISFNYNKGKVNITGSLNQQFGFIKEPEMLPPAKDVIWGGVSVSVDL